MNTSVRWLVSTAMVSIIVASAVVSRPAAGAEGTTGSPMAERAARLEVVVDSLGFVGRADSADVLVNTFLHEARQSRDSAALLSGLLLRGRIQAALDRPDSGMAVLKRATSVWRSEREVPLDPRWREERARLARRAHTKLAALQLDHPRDRSVEERTRTAFDTLQGFKTRSVVENMTSPGHDVLFPAGLDLPVELEALQGGILEPGELVLDVHLGPDESILFAISMRACRAVRLPGLEQELGDEIEVLRALVASPPRRGDGTASEDEDALRAALRSLGELLLGEVTDLVRTSPRILFVPDGPLHLLPLSALPLGAEGAVLVEGREILRVPSVSTLARLRRSTPAGPDEPVSVLAVAGAGGGGRPALGAARREVEGLGAGYRRVQVRAPGGAAVPRVAPRELGRFSVIHLAGQTEVDDENPWLSGVLLVPAYELERTAKEAEAGPDPSVLRAEEIAGLELSTRLVVVSGSAVAGGRVVSGEGVLALTTAFLGAGARAVATTLWPVDDEATARLVAHFYQELAKGVGAAAALRQAQLRVRREPGASDPLHWAGFVLVGDGETRIELEKVGRGRSNVVLTWIFVAGVVYLVWLWIGPGRGRGPTPPTRDVHPDQLKDRA